MKVGKKFWYKRLDANGESQTIHTAEVSKRSKANDNKLEQPDKAVASSRQTMGREESSYTEPRKPPLTFGLLKVLEEIDRGIHNYVGGLGVQHVNLAGEVINHDGSGSRAGYAPEGQDSARTEEDVIIQLEGEPHRYTYNQLSVATRGFCEESKLGHGGFGNVYRGVLPSGLVAVKKMNHGTTQSQGMKEFKAEISIISGLRHRNMIELLGWCEDSVRKEYMVVYELMPKGSLDDVLFKPADGMTYLSWPQRFKILTGTADALAYLHEGLKKQVIHRDIKCSNIMLDEQWNAKLGDFGIARLLDHEGQAETTNMAGTMGYMAPEVFNEGRFTDKTDIFAFGVVVLEVACGRRVLPGRFHETGLVSWVRQSLTKGDLLRTVEKRLKNYDMWQAETVLMIGLACCHTNPWERPSMRHVVQMLAGESLEELMEMIVLIKEEETSNSRPGPYFEWSSSNSTEIQQETESQVGRRSDGDDSSQVVSSQGRWSSGDQSSQVALNKGRRS